MLRRMLLSACNTTAWAIDGGKAFTKNKKKTDSDEITFISLNHGQPLGGSLACMELG